MIIGITGATGFLGSYFVDYLLNIGNYNIKALTRNPAKINKDINWFVGDLSSQFDCDKFIQDVDIIIHFAHNNNSQIISNNDVISDAGLNLVPNLTLLESIKKKGRKIHFIYISSGGGIYGKSANKIPFKETDCCNPFSSYGIQKLTMENYLRLWAAQEYLTSAVLRVSNPYGVLLPSNRKQGLIGVVLNKIIRGEVVQIFGNPDNVRDYIHLKDMSKAIEQAFNLQGGFEIYNIGSGQGVSVNEVLNLIEKYSGKKMKREYLEDKNAQILPDWNVLDITKAKENLSWQPEIIFEQGLKSLCEEVYQYQS